MWFRRKKTYRVTEPGIFDLNQHFIWSEVLNRNLCHDEIRSGGLDHEGFGFDREFC